MLKFAPNEPMSCGTCAPPFPNIATAAAAACAAAERLDPNPAPGDPDTDPEANDLLQRVHFSFEYDDNYLNYEAEMIKVKL